VNDSRTGHPGAPLRDVPGCRVEWGWVHGTVHSPDGTRTTQPVRAAGAARRSRAARAPGLHGARSARRGCVAGGIPMLKQFRSRKYLASPVLILVTVLTTWRIGMGNDPADAVPEPVSAARAEEAPVAVTWDLPVTYNDDVERWIEFLARSE